MNPVAKLQSDVLKGSNDPKGMQAAMANYFQFTEENSEGLIAQKGISLDCRQGCAMCCYFRVEVRAHEVFAVARFVETQFSDSEKAALMSRLDEHVSRISRMSSAEHRSTNVPCPLLVDSKCSVYPARPFGCRSHHSKDVSACRATFEHPEENQEFPGVQDHDLLRLWMRMAGLAHGVFEHQGFDRQHYELGAALLTALTNPDAMKRWRQKKDPKLASPQP